MGVIPGGCAGTDGDVDVASRETGPRMPALRERTCQQGGRLRDVFLAGLVCPVQTPPRRRSLRASPPPPAQGVRSRRRPSAKGAAPKMQGNVARDAGEAKAACFTSSPSPTRAEKGERGFARRVCRAVHGTEPVRPVASLPPRSREDRVVRVMSCISEIKRLAGMSTSSRGPWAFSESRRVL